MKQAQMNGMPRTDWMGNPLEAAPINRRNKPGAYRGEALGLECGQRVRIVASSEALQFYLGKEGEVVEIGALAIDAGLRAIRVAFANGALWYFRRSELEVVSSETKNGAPDKISGRQGSGNGYKQKEEHS